MKLFYLIYNIFLLFLFIIYSPVLLYKVVIRGKYREGIKERFGFLPLEKIKRVQDEPVIWVHAVSVGETVAASPVVKEIKRKFPAYKIVFSTVTDTGQEMARKIVEEADLIIYFPLDFSWIVKRVLRKINPQLVVLTETELWPVFINSAVKNGAEVMLVNGRISDSSFKYYHYLGPILKDMLANIDFFSMQSEQDLEYILKLGADPDKCANLGNTKFDQVYAQPDQTRKEKIYQEFKINKNAPVLVAGSTHPGEEEQLLSVYQKLQSQFADLVMILAPRHIKRSAQIRNIFKKAGIRTVLRTEIARRKPAADKVILLDTIGELAGIYSVADLVFVGGSLIEKGGHNILEPAVQGKLVFFGPHMFNFKANTRLVLNYGVGVQVSNQEELTEKMLYYLKNRAELEKKGRQAVQMVEENKGAALRNAEIIEKLSVTG